MTSGLENLRTFYRGADAQDRADGLAAYRIYNQVIRGLADHYGHTFERVLSAFVALSPNSDYFGNLRSLVSLLDGIRNGVPCHRVTLSTYNHCRDRAWDYLWGRDLFLATAKGPKIRSFFLNIFDPENPDPVTVDGHMVLAWRNDPLGTMKGAMIRAGEYEKIATAVRRIARQFGVIPNQVQATIWLVRKRQLRIKFDAQLDMFSHPIAVRIDEIYPYPPKQEGINRWIDSI